MVFTFAAIGGIFEESDNKTIEFFLNAIRRSFIRDSIELIPEIQIIKPGNSFEAERAGLFNKRNYSILWNTLISFF